MAASGSTSRAIYAGLSCGFVFAVPVAAYVATIPFSDANNTVTACALPFTVGALAGVGILSAVSAVGRHHAAAVAEDEAYGEEPSFGAAQGTTAFHAAEHHHEHEGVERFFGNHKVPKDVPVIARAQDALSEEEAWADIDSMLSEDSPISCDAATSKDIYQIALEELQREAAAAQAAQAAATGAWSAPAAANTWATAADVMAADDVPAAAPATAVDERVVPAAQDTRRAVISPADTFIAAGQAMLSEDASLGGAAALAGAALYASEPAGEAGSAAAAAPAASVPDTTTVMLADDLAEPTAQVGASDEYDTDAAQQAALASLDEIDGARIQPRTPLVHLTADEPAAEQRAAAAPATEPATVTPASYAGHEDMWAAALAILMGEEPVAADPEQPAYVPRHMRRADAAPAAPEVTGEVARAAAVAEGRRANEMHTHVNSLIEEELGQVPSSSVRRSSREYLRVIQGGTASMPRLKAEA